MKRHKRHSRGFTLIELMVVVLLMGMVAAISFPRFYPLIAFGRLEGAAKHMANFGRGAMAEAVMLQQDLTVRIDLGEQRYDAVRWVDPRILEEEAERAEAAAGEGDMLGMLPQLKAKEMERFGALGTSPRDRAGNLDGYQRYMATLEDFFGEMPDDFDAELADQQMMAKFERFARRATMARAQNVKHERFLEETDLFEGRRFRLEDDDEPVEQPVKNPTLMPVRLSPDVTLEAVAVDGVVYTRGLVEIDLSPLGLSSEVGFHFVSVDGDYYTVFWDPTLGGAKVVQGKEPLV